MFKVNIWNNDERTLWVLWEWSELVKEDGITRTELWKLRNPRGHLRFISHVVRRYIQSQGISIYLSSRTSDQTHHHETIIWWTICSISVCIHQQYRLKMQLILLGQPTTIATSTKTAGLLEKSQNVTAPRLMIYQHNLSR